MTHAAITETRFNGFDPEAMTTLVENVAKGAAEATAAFHVRSEWRGQARAEAIVEGYEMSGASIARRHRISSDEPRELLGTDAAPNPQELLFAALNACMMFGYATTATKMGIELNSLAVETRGAIDLRGALELAEVPKGMPKISCSVFIRSSAPRNQLEELHRTVLKNSPNYYHVTQPIPVEATLITE